MAEIWKNIPGIPKIYFVSNLGRFKSIGRKENGSRRICVRKDKFLKPSLDSSGYYNIGFIISGTQKCFLAHRVVAKVFIKNPKRKKCVNHKDGNKQNNSVSNLEWATHSENQIHAFKTGLRCNKGMNHPTHILTEKEVLEIRSKYIPKIYSSYKLANEYGVNRVTINDVINRKTWKHI